MVCSISSRVTQWGAPGGTATAAGRCERSGWLPGIERSSEQFAFDLVAVDGPTAIRLFLSAVKLQVWSGTDLLDEPAKQKRFATMNGAASELPASYGSVMEIASCSAEEAGAGEHWVSSMVMIGPGGLGPGFCGPLSPCIGIKLAGTNVPGASGHGMALRR